MILNERQTNRDGIIKLLISDHNVGNNKNVKNIVNDSSNKKSPKCMKKDVTNAGKNTDDFILQDNLTEDAVNYFTHVTRKRVNKRNITIIGDSIIKDVKSFKLNKSLPSNTKVYVK